MDSISIGCIHCKENVIIKVASDPNVMIYSGKCNNSFCTNPKMFVCKPCYDYSIKNTVLKGGRKTAQFTTMKSLKQHVKNADVHKLALIDYVKLQKSIFENKIDDINLDVSHEINDGNIDASNDSDVTSVFDDNNTVSDNSNYTTHDNYNAFDLNSKSIKYYKYEKKYPGHGPKYLIGNAFHKREEDYEKISTEEVDFFLKLSSLLTQLTKSQQQLLADIILAASNSKDKSLSIFGDHTRVPTSMQDFEHIILSKERSILTNLPHPIVKETQDGSHAYVSLIDLLSNELAADTQFDQFHFHNNESSDPNMKDLTTISKSKAANNMYWKLHEPQNEDNIHIMYLWLKEWRDAFDPNSTKSSRNQVWIQTFTISPPECARAGKNTYLMSLSGKSEDHSVIDHIYGKEIEHLSTIGMIFYHGGKNKMIKVKLGKLIICVDRPERTSMFLVGDHAGVYSTMWGHAGEVDGQMKKNYLPSCVQCRSKRIMEFFENGITYDNIMECESGKNCCGWDVFHSNFSYPTPNYYPTTSDCSINAPQSPIGRTVFGRNTIVPDDLVQSSKRHKTTDANQKLNMVNMTVTWLKEVCNYAYHNITTKDMNSKQKKPYWTKRNLVAFLRTCGISSDMIQKIYLSSNSKNDKPIEFPETWQDDLGIEKCHYAGMHMLFLGHVKSNFEMISIWFSKQSINASFGKQANLYLEFVKKMRINKYYSAHNLATSTWGTGSWVSENYLFFARTQKFFITMPAIRKSKKMIQLDEDYIIEYRTILRFITSSSASISRIMSSKKTIKDLDCLIKIYMDCMVEMDSNILKYATSETYFWENDDNMDDEVAKKKKNPNFVKSNSLGILAVAKAHEHFGPLLLNWEGGYAGERKIQEVKPLLSIKRENADWEKITLSAHYQLETITNLLEITKSKSKGSINVKPNRENNGSIKIFGSKIKADEAISQCLPLSGIVDQNHDVWIAYRPTGENTCRSSIGLLQLEFDDTNGEDVLGICWMSPIKQTDNEKIYDSMDDCCSSAMEFALLLPQLSDNGLNFINKYYVIGHKWTERNSMGKFEWSNLSFDSVFKDWEIISTDNASL